MISFKKAIAVVIVVIALSAGAFIVRSEFDRRKAPEGNLAAQERAAQKDVRQEINSACAALRQMGGTDKNCPAK